jgi:hypothetical protein
MSARRETKPPWARKSRKTRGARPPQARRLLAEPLEDRRLLSEWQLDPSFDTDGKATTALARLNSDGSPDSTFGTPGVLTTDLNAGSSDALTGLARQSDGRVVLAGYTDFDPGAGYDYDVAVARYVGLPSLTTEDLTGPLTPDNLAGLLVGPGVSVLNFSFTGGETAAGPFAGGPYAVDFNDLDGDGVRDPNEPGLDGWTIELLDAQGQVIRTQVTQSADFNGDQAIDPASEQGLYAFDRLRSGRLGAVLVPHAVAGLHRRREHGLERRGRVGPLSRDRFSKRPAGALAGRGRGRGAGAGHRRGVRRHVPRVRHLAGPCKSGQRRPLYDHQRQP